MHYALFVYALLFGHLLFAQEYAPRYAPLLQPGETLVSAGAQRATVAGPEGHSRRLLIYPETGQLLEELHYVDNGVAEVRQGPARYYRHTGELEHAGQYHHDTLTGEWRYYHRNGQLQRAGRYRASRPTGDWLFYDTLGRHTFTRRYDYRSRFDGPFEQFDSTGAVINTGVYTNGRLTSQTHPERNVPPRLPERPPLFGDCAAPDLDSLGQYRCSRTALGRFVNAQVQYPEAAVREDIVGRVLVRFAVDPDGRVIDATVERGVSAALDREALRVIRAMPAWQPALLDGQSVRTERVLPISFRLR